MSFTRSACGGYGLSVCKVKNLAAQNRESRIARFPETRAGGEGEADSRVGSGGSVPKKTLTKNSVWWAARLKSLTAVVVL